jgi:16S rRNA (adenine1518-N6/adenine1519-N6)-dimethyltransferase
LNTRSDIKAILDAHQVRLRRSQGQSFLVDDAVLASIARIAGADRPDTIIEIGAGLGTLTRWLADSARRVIALERDAHLVSILRSLLPPPTNIELVEGDALEVDFGELGGVSRTPRPSIAGNLPYSITSPLLFHLLEQRDRIGPTTIMVQREVADRLIAEPGSKDYGSLSIMLQLWAEISAELEVPPESFIPRPRVYSTVLRIDWLARPRVPIDDPRHFERVVRAGFSRRRKTLRNALSSTFLREAIEDAGAVAQIELDRRAETLTLADFSRLASALLPSGSRSKASDP